MVKPQIMEKNLELELAKGDCHVEMKSDFKKISHIVQNIISNAVKFTEKGNISISVVEKNGMAVIHVQDTGIGIAKENLAHIFDEFRQADSGTSRKYGGTGLGLSIAKKYAELLGGSISVESEVGLGSHFMIYLPIELNLDSYSELQNQYENSFKSHIFDFKTNVNHNITILLVDDSDPAIIQMKDFLEESGFNVKIAHNGQEALHQIQNEIPDGIILDLMMPEMDGFSLLKLIRDNEITTNIPVLIVTAKHITKDEMSFLKKNNIFQFIQKGDVNHEEFIQAVSGMVSIQKNIIKEKVNPQFVKPIHPSDKRCKILIVEDNPDNMLTVKVLLQDNYDLIEAYDGKEGVELALLHIPDLILMDISLPVLDGIQAFKQIRKHPSLEHIPIIALTASALTEDREKILAEGFDHFLPKPIEEQTFYTTIKEVLYGI
jgi:CheY-like chemotaxis protein/anti-sigma regulatory factor (Ser/Thr protein kinase)